MSSKDRDTDEQVHDLADQPPTDAMASQVKGGAAPSTPTPVPVPYPNLKSIQPRAIVPCI